MNENDKESFNYTYSAPQCDEIEKIRMKYETKCEEDKLDRLRRLDKSTTRKASAVAIAIGVIGALLLGAGMSLIMTELYESFNLDYAKAVIVGTVAGLFGIALVCLAYPIYGKRLKKERKKLAPEILKLTDELMK